mgnify:CR=1 FL=1
MKKYFIYFLVLISIINCNSDLPATYFKNKKKSVSTKQLPKKKIKSFKKQNSKLITNSNVRRKLNEYARNHTSNKIKISTIYGNIIVELYDETPLHRANFLMLAKKGFFDSTLFYRVINNFMIQGGNSDKDNMLHKMAKIGNYKIPPEINEKYIHKRGALAMAVQEQYFMDPNKYDPASSPYNFYIVQKGPLSNNYMDKIESKYKIKIPKKDRLIYNSIGGNPHLDNRYTVFGEVIKGMSVVDEIAFVITNEKNRPLKNVYLTMQVLN